MFLSVVKNDQNSMLESIYDPNEINDQQVTKQ